MCIRIWRRVSPVGAKSLGREVGVPSLWPRLGGVLQQHGLGVIRSSGGANSVAGCFSEVISHMPVSSQRLVGERSGSRFRFFEAQEMRWPAASPATMSSTPSDTLYAPTPDSRRNSLLSTSNWG